MTEIFDDFKLSVKKNYPKHASKILKALAFATDAHKDAKRKSGEPYIVHPVSVAQILIDNNMDYTTIMAGLLHDVVEDTRYTNADIEKEFGKTVAKLVDGVTKLDNLTYKETSFTEADSIKRLLIAMGHDLRVIFIKLADRLHNMRTIEFLKREKQIKMARETQDLFIPIADRIGVRAIRSELEQLVFKCLYPEECERIKQEFDRKFKKREPQIKDIEEKLNFVLKSNDIDAKIIGWREHYYSIFKKQSTQGIGKIFGLMLYKIIVPTELDCYKALGLIHRQFKHLPSQIKDFISSPKPNGYKSLHSVLISDNYDVTFKVMIRTPEMDEICEFGVASAWKDKDSDVIFNENILKYNDMKNIILSENDSENSINFIDAIKTNLASNVTWVFTPKFKPICLSSDKPTAIDFAYAVHTSIGNNAVGAVINGKKASLGAILSTGDVVEIVLSNEEKSPSRDWLMVAKTPYARKRIKEYIAKNSTSSNIEKGKQMIKEELEKEGHTLGDLIDLYPKISQEFNFISLDDMFASVGFKSIKVPQLTKFLVEKVAMEKCKDTAPVLIEGSNRFLNVTFPKCCSAIPGDDIVAIMSRDNLAVHTKNCLNVSKSPKEKLLAASWKEGICENFNVNLKIVAKDTVGFGATLLAFFAKNNFSLSKLEGKKVNMQDCEFELSIPVKNTSELKVLTDAISKMDGVKFVGRASE